ncbi:FAD-dependent monooxygenase [Aquimarina sediminis]|uniref:FAD-dependent monooxygenase n=1 Tax=Aquimarina sediminis TaxID=2070536 RepID=UPI000CA08C0A|nr:FAD-dependent monooxygenase [Aquimarina sediminis]
MNLTILGGGIGGLTTALCLEKLNIPFKLYEQAKEIKAIGSGIWLSPNALQVINWIDNDLLKEIVMQGNALDRITVADHKLNTISDSDQGFVREKFGFTTVAIHRGILQKILFNFASKKNIYLDKKSISFEKEEANSYTITFEDGSLIKTNSVIGADGIHSKIRKHVFPDSKLRYTGQTCWRGVSSYVLPQNLHATGLTLWGQKLQFGISKIAEDKVYWFAVKKSNPNLKDDKNNLKIKLEKMFSGFDPMVNGIINDTPSDQIIRTDLYDLELLNAWNTEHICLIGDAAHSMTPDLGQGGAQAIEDAFYLANILQKQKDTQKAFQMFFETRKKKVQKLVKQSRITSKIAITNPVGEKIRNFVLRNTPEKYIQNQMIDLYTLKFPN